MVKPRDSGSVYFNYKKTFSTSLMAIVDANYRFLAYDIGRPGRMSDSGIWFSSSLRKLFEPSEDCNMLNIPKHKLLADHLGRMEPNGKPIPYHLVGDDGFGIHERLIKPYTKDLDAKMNVFNYRLSRARQTVEVAFGILAARFRVLFNKVYASVENASLIVEASVLLHNYILDKRPLIGKEKIEQAKEDYRLLEQLPRQGYNINVNTGAGIRSYIKEYFIDTYPIKYQYERNNL